ncbi:hypothetical protein GCM10010377_83110 [Streptomyces viridiviolaceus]|nr:hypothetical protein GCM10010377_83110 [Streptomyces viridiviolaceus]
MPAAAHPAPDQTALGPKAPAAWLTTTAPNPATVARTRPGDTGNNTGPAAPLPAPLLPRHCLTAYTQVTGTACGNPCSAVPVPAVRLWRAGTWCTWLAHPHGPWS